MPTKKDIQLTETDTPLLDKLSPEQKAVITASGTIDVIAATLNIPAGTVKSRLHRARKNLGRLRAQAAMTV